MKSLLHTAGKKILEIINHHSYLSLLIIIAFGLFLRTVNFTDNFYFGHDQARDLLRIYDMIHTPNLKIVGPETDIPGLFCGPLYYYLLGIFYAISNFDPNAGVFMHILINLTGIPLLYYFGSVIKDKKLGVIASVLWAVSFEQINYSHWLSNPAFLSISTTIFFLGLYLFFIKKRQIGLPISMIGYGIGTQLDFYLVYLFIFYPLMYFFFPQKPDRKSVLQSLTIFILLFGSFAIAEIRFHFIGIQSFFGYVTGQSLAINIFDRLEMFVNGISKSLYYSLFVLNNFFALLIFVALGVIVFWKEKWSPTLIFLSIWLLSTFPLFGFSQTNIVSGTFVHGSIQGVITILVAFGIYTLIKVRKHYFAYLILGGFIIGNIVLFAQNNFSATTILGHQNWIYKDQKDVAEYTYESARSKPFSICAMTNPLFINNHWSTLYYLNGQKEYNYLPIWTGPAQEGDTFFEESSDRPMTRYLIIDPSHQFMDFAYRVTVYAEDQVSVLDDQKKFGEIIVQKRHIPEDPSELKDTQNLTPEQHAEVLKVLSIDPRYSCR
ncbi:hypothetical protein COY16_03315 [Candidatus Roizmanbacteria bacterium CG_4_10_14_0_2_um_filter_39_13]|uniref:Glycosyltransferase RgtA/B/C/D-like domain-containing protein n=1 Tax=Candidatus Roizmanbacteria bacterium CG_4_10_14_0_2_um_filter_39_13 TaxID=1974825 RepID=A0A2M7TYF1_9BACT|nr:MAG: hypothetical protein COY16_03315 [Candidatus Roizmanbacteria bacterium CG_4_10_14_0_2_um_filter_39_13]